MVPRQWFQSKSKAEPGSVDSSHLSKHLFWGISDHEAIVASRCLVIMRQNMWPKPVYVMPRAYPSITVYWVLEVNRLASAHENRVTDEGVGLWSMWSDHLGPTTRAFMDLLGGLSCLEGLMNHIGLGGFRDVIFEMIEPD